MQTKRQSILTAWILKPEGYRRYIMLSAIVILLPIIYTVVYFTGGIKYAYSHTMYLPIIMAAIIFGVHGGFIIGLIAGFLLGPMMPLTITPVYEAQNFLNWFYRILFFCGIGSIVGYLCFIGLFYA